MKGKEVFRTVTIYKKGPFEDFEVTEECYDIPNTMPLPPMGSMFFYEDTIYGRVLDIHYHVKKDGDFMISIFVRQE